MEQLDHEKENLQASVEESTQKADQARKDVQNARDQHAKVRDNAKGLKERLHQAEAALSVAKSELGDSATKILDLECALSDEKASSAQTLLRGSIRALAEMSSQLASKEEHVAVIRLVNAAATRRAEEERARERRAEERGRKARRRLKSFAIAWSSSTVRRKTSRRCKSRHKRQTKLVVQNARDQHAKVRDNAKGSRGPGRGGAVRCQV